MKKIQKINNYSITTSFISSNQANQINFTNELSKFPKTKSNKLSNAFKKNYLEKQFDENLKEDLNQNVLFDISELKNAKIINSEIENDLDSD